MIRLFIIWMAAGMTYPVCLGQSLMLHSDGDHLWYIQPDRSQDLVTIWHGNWHSNQAGLHFVQKLNGRVKFGSSAAAEDVLWLIYSDMTVQMIRVQPGSARIEGWWSYDRQAISALPQQAVLRAMTAGNSGPCVILQGRAVELEQAINAQASVGQLPRDGLDASQLIDYTSRGIIFEFDHPQVLEQGDRVESEDAEVADSSAPDQPVMKQPPDTDTLIDVLLIYHHGRWERVPLPDGWDMTLPVRLVMQRYDDLMPVILATDVSEQSVNLYRYKEDEWLRQALPCKLEESTDNRTTALSLQDQLILATRQEYDTESLEASVSVLREQKVVPIGELHLALPSSSQWSVVPMLEQLALVGLEIAVDPSDKSQVTGKVSGKLTPLSWSAMNLQGEVVEQDRELVRVYGRSDAEIYFLFVFLIIAGLVALLAMVFLRREPYRDDIQLPDNLVPGDLDRRLVAGWLDLMPGFIGVWLFYPVEPSDLISPWLHVLWDVTQWQQLKPVLLVIGIFVAHTTITELFTGRTIGKLLTGLRIVTREGRPADIRQRLLRGLSKFFDLVAWFLLVVPLLTPYRQRLGDLLAGTVVVMDRPRESDKTGESDSEEKQEGP